LLKIVGTVARPSPENSGISSPAQKNVLRPLAWARYREFSCIAGEPNWRFSSFAGVSFHRPWA
ncbi:hypothetical protein, partial [Pseudomonas aeruginosa]|uniref:hypothetical protein n=1 Tax=Pseudomonas aeruginosa TaxID=287 RepID=UPI003CE9FBF4